MPPPDRWLDYSPVGKVIPRTKFIAFKVPLKKALLQSIPEKDQFGPDILVNRIQEQGSNLGLVIDLTFTKKYYNSQEFERKSIAYKKIYVQGAKSGQTVPTDSNFLEFADTVKSFSKNDTDGKLIGVHCTHGLNRTGYLICRYMIEELEFEPSEAIALFNDSRGHDMERDAYLTDLKERKKGVKTEPSDEPLQRSEPPVGNPRLENRLHSSHSSRENDQRYHHDENVDRNFSSSPRQFEQRADYRENRPFYFDRRDPYHSRYQPWSADSGSFSNHPYRSREEQDNRNSNFRDYDRSSSYRDTDRSNGFRDSHRSNGFRDSHRSNGYRQHRDYERPNSYHRNQDGRYLAAGWSTQEDSLSHQQYGQFGRREY